MPAIRARSPASASCPDLLMRRRRVDEATDSPTGPRRPRTGYGDDIPAHTQYQGGLPNRLPAVDDWGNSGRRVPRRHYPTISYPCDKNTHLNNTPSDGHSETIYRRRKLMGRKGAPAGGKEGRNDHIVEAGEIVESGAENRHRARKHNDL
ncbi:hypothetical protein THAOC_04361 [Thalassiosira oceanica]|uniref:Uncharacterized protein n=1 Tax=Thalassiosira oceanica TaxID=159749 RepID=K0TA54_THAOC|nr:hypothetical protein THAOC_04361 [Thalassiosira oceanica]|eukprot:EJK73989.1 hypothetical protein THAOC_04361 [Thalassiosira oceanica]